MYNLHGLRTWPFFKVLASYTASAIILVSLAVSHAATTPASPLVPTTTTNPPQNTTPGPIKLKGSGGNAFGETLQAIGVGSDALDRLQRMNVNSFAELRRRMLAGNEDLAQLRTNDKAKLRRAAVLALLSSDVQLNAELAKHEFASVADLAKLSPATLRIRSGERLSIDEAKRYQEKARVLKRLVDKQVLQLTVASRDPTRFAALPPESQALARKLTSEQNGNTCTESCDGEESFFSPAVYLIYLLDFLEKSFPDDFASLESIDSLERIDQRFFQRFEDLPTSQDAEFSDSYVRFTNQVLENYIATLENPPRAWETPEQQRANRVQVFDREFQKPEYDIEQGFTKNIVSELFDAYLRVMGVSPQDIRTITAIPADHVGLKEELAASLGLDLREAIEDDASRCVPNDPRDGLRLVDLTAFSNESVNLNALDKLREKTIGSGKYGALYRWHWRKASREVGQESAASAADEIRTEFSKHLRMLRSNAIECVSTKLQRSIEASDASMYQQALSEVAERAKECVASGQNCPKPKCENVVVQQKLGATAVSCACDNETCGTIAGILCCEGYTCKAKAKGPDASGTCVPETPFSCSYEDKPYSPPIIPLRELFRHYANLFDAPAGAPGCSNAQPDTAQAAICADKQLEEIANRIKAEIEDAVGTETELSSGGSQTPPAEPTPAQRKLDQQIKERLYSEYEFDRQFERLSREVIKKDCTREGKTEFLDEVTRRADEAWRASVAKAEAGFLSKIRTNLIAVALHKQAARVSPPGDRPPGTSPPGSGGSGDNPPPSSPEGPGGVGNRTLPSTLSTKVLDPTTRPPGQQPSPPPLPLLTEANIQALSDYLFMDLAVDESLRTTPLSAAIGRIHSLVQALRLGTANRNLQGELFDLANFDDAVWEWLQSYGIWHAAMMVSLYPESFLIPEVRTGTPQFESVTQSDTTSSMGKVVAFRNAIDKLRSLKVVTTVRAGETTFVFSKPCCSSGMYYSTLDSNGRWNLWRKIDGADTREGYAMYDSVYREGYVFLFRMIDVVDDNNLWKFRVTVLPLKVNTNGTLDNGAGSRNEEESSAEELWQELGDAFKLSGFGKLHFAVTYPKNSLEQGRVITRSSIVAMNSKTKQIRFQRINLSVPGQVSLDAKPPPKLYESIKDGYEDATITDSLQKVDGYPGMLLWHIDGRLRFVDAEDMIAGGTGYILPFDQNLSITPDAGISAIRLNEDFTYVFYDALEAAVSPSGNELPGKFHVVDVLSGSNLKGWAFEDSINLYVPDGETSIQAGLYSNSVVSAIVKPTTEEVKWKLYHVTTDTSSNLSLPRYLRVRKTNSDLLYQLVSKEDPVRIYLDEFYLHLPMFLSDQSRDSGRFEVAKNLLSWIYDPFAALGKRERYPGLSNGGSNESILLRWLKDPFNPYATADNHPETYLVATRMAHVENLLDWADRLFLRDTFESVNRARKLYEQAGSILGAADWTTGDCTVELRNASSQTVSSNSLSIPGARVEAFVSGVSHTDTLSADSKLSKIIEKSILPGFKEKIFESSVNKSARTGATIQSLLDRRKSTQTTLADVEEVGVAVLGDAVAQELNSALSSEDAVTIGHEFPQPDLSFCIPHNPLVDVLRWRIDANLAKIRTNRNFAGMPRQLQPYATPLDPTKLVKQAASGGIDFDEYIPSLPPPIYRYAFLHDRAKALALSAQQLEGSALSAIKEAEETDYRVMQARQDVQLERSNVTLQTLRMKEANDGKTLADAQMKRAEDHRDHYASLVDGGLSGAERSALFLMMNSAQFNYLAIGANLSQVSLTGPSPNFAGAFSSAAAMQNTFSSIASMQASFERRAEEWGLQLALGNDDIAIADAGIRLAEDRIGITEQERSIAELRLENSNDTVEFLQDRFTNAALYRWMHKNLRRLYRDQLNFAISTARAAQRALEFERQTSLDFISTDYWDEERAGLVGAERLLKDLDKMEQHRLTTATRKKEIEKTISLASLMPAEFQQFRNTGVLDFETQMKWFDRDFPGHYMRLIRDVSVSVVALVPPNEGIHATLSNPGISRVMVGNPWEQYSTIYRLPESVALSGASKATGLFELNPNDPMLLPFEGNGVATMWRLEMPKGANRFDFGSLYDVLLTIRYTALEDRDYRTKVLDDLGQTDEGFVKTGAVRYFSLRDTFPDQWYHLLNPIIGKDEYWDPRSGQPDNGKPQKPYIMAFNIDARNFVPNEDRRKIKKVTLAMQIDDGEEFEDEWCIPISLNFAGGTSSAPARLKNNDVFAAVDGLNGKQPYGQWVLTTGAGCSVGGNEPPMTSDLAEDLSERVQDLWVIVEYDAWVHYNR